MYRILLQTLLFYLILSLSVDLNAQEKINDNPDSVDTIAIEKVKRKYKRGHFGVFGEMGKVIAPHPQRSSDNNFLGGGVYRGRWHIGTFLFLNNDYFTIPVIFPNEAVLRYLYGGGFIGYSVITKGRHHLLGRTYLGGGDMIWEDEDTFFNYFNDRFWVIKPEIRYEFKVFHLIDLYALAGYTFFTEIDMPEVNRKDFSGVTMGMGIKLIISNRLSVED